MEASRQSYTDLAVQFVRGFPFPGNDRFPRKHIESALDYKPQEGDVFVCTYPKSGTTWVLYVIHQILCGTEMPLPTMEEMEQIMPFLDCLGAEAAMSLNSPRVMISHVPYHLVPKSPLAKYISIIRNPYDVAVSYFYFLRNTKLVDLCLDKFVDYFISRNMIYGNYFDHVLSWYEHRDDHNVLLLSYDKMSLDPKKGLLKIAKFLGDDYFNRLNKDEVLVKKILERTSFHFMKKNLSYTQHENQPARITQSGIYPFTFFRKSTVGDYKNHLTQEDIENIKTWIAEKSTGTEIKRFWRV